MTLTELRPFGRRRKTYFYGVAGFVLAAHVVVGGMIYVLPPALDQEAPALVGVEMQIVDHLISGDVIETGAVNLIEEPEVIKEPEVIEVEPLSFEPVWDSQPQPQPIVPESELIGPTVSDLLPLIIEFKDDEVVENEIEENPAEVATPKETPKVASTPPKKKTASSSKSKPKSKPKTSTSKKTKPVQRRTAVRSRPKPTRSKPAYTPPKPRPIPRPIPKAVPTNREPERTGLLDRLRDRRERS